MNRSSVEPAAAVRAVSSSSARTTRVYAPGVTAPGRPAAMAAAVTTPCISA